MEHTEGYPESYSGSAEVRTEDQDQADVQAEAQSSHNTFGHAAQDVTKDAQRRGQEVFGKVADEAQTFVGRLRGEATGALGEGKAQLASQIGGVARALKASSREFRNDDLTGLANLSSSLAAEVETAQHYLDEKSSEALLTDLRTFATRHRGLFVGSLFLAGLVAVRFSRTGADASAADVASAPRSKARPVVVAQGRSRRVGSYRTGRS